VNDLVFLLFRFEVRNLEPPYNLQRHDERLIRVGPTSLSSDIFPELPQCTENPRPIEPLTLTVFAVIHHQISTKAPNPAYRRIQSA
jgi:hypothetical protein